jgi:hypothetical protein
VKEWKREIRFFLILFAAYCLIVWTLGAFGYLQ